MLYILYGPDDYSIAQELEIIKKSAGDPSMLTTNTAVLAGTEITVNDLRVACETVPFLADNRLVIMYGLLERYTPRQSLRTSSRRREAQIIDYAVVGDIINNIPSSTILILVENELAVSNPLFKIISNKAQMKAFPMLKTPQLREWINRRITEEGANISPTAISMLTRLVGSNLWIMSSELNKLAIYADDRRIEEKDVQALVSYTQQSNVFAMVDAIVEFDIHKAETMLQQLLNEGDSPTQLLNMLVRQMRLIVRAKDLKQQKVSETEMRGRLGLPADWLVRKTVDQASHYTFARIKQVYQQLLDTDIAIKTGKYDGELALNILIAELCQNPKSDISPQKQGVTA